MTHLRADALRRGRLRVLIAGVSTRAAAESAARAGFDVTSLDGYADRDQHPSVRALAVPRDLGLEFSAANAAMAAAGIECDAVAYLSNFENDPTAVAALAANRTLWGNPPDILRRARDPFTVAHTFRAHGFSVPRLANDSNDSNDSNDWLLKPFSSGGGHGIRPWQGTTVPRGCYLQQRIEGRPGAIVFVAADGRAIPLGVSRQLVGDRRFGASGVRYCGSILAPHTDPQFERGAELLPAVDHLAAVAAGEFELVGVNGIDFIEQSGIPYPIEINPRWSASMDLIERSLAVGVFAAHAAACTQGHLPEPPPPPDHAAGKAIVFAREACIAGDTDAWLADAGIRDVPRFGDRIAEGSPVCTVLAEGADAAACEAALVHRARRIYADMRRWVSPIHDSQFAIHDSNE